MPPNSKLVENREIARANHIALAFFVFCAILLTPILTKAAYAKGCGASYEVGTQHFATQGDIFAALQEASGDPDFAAAGSSLSHNVEDTTGDLALSNGCGYLGLFQMSARNIKDNAGMGREQFAAADAGVQARAWTKFFQTNYRTVAKNIASLGETFDGQPVDNAFRIACVQLGTKNCQTMIKSKSCSGYAGDKNGMNICMMATKLRRGEGQTDSTSNPGNIYGRNTMTNVDDAVRDPNYAGTGGTTMPLGNTAYCWSCDIIVYSLAGAETLVTSALPSITAALWPILAVAFAIGLLWNMLQSLALGTSPLAKTVPLLIRFAFVATLITSAGSGIAQIILDETIAPIINSSATLGERIAWSADKALSITIPTSTSEAATQAIANSASATGYIPLFNITPQQGSGTASLNNDCIYEASANVNLTHLVAAEAATTSLACTIHHIEAAVQNIGVIFMSLDSTPDATKMGNLAKLGINAAGMLIATTSMLGMLKYGATVMAVILEIGCITAFAPYIFFCTIFPSTRQIPANYCKRILHAGMTLCISGIAAMTGLLCLLQSLFFGAGLDPTNTNLDPMIIVNQANTFMTSFSVLHPQTWAATVRFILFAMAGSSTCNTMLDQGSRIASQITGTKNSEALSSALAVTVATAVKMIGKNAPLLLAPMAKQGGKLFGALTRPPKDSL